MSSDTNISHFSESEKKLSQSVHSQKKGRERILLPKWPEMLTFVFDKSKLVELIPIERHGYIPRLSK